MKAILNIYNKRNVIEGFGYPDGGGHENPDIFDGSNIIRPRRATFFSPEETLGGVGYWSLYEPVSQ